MKARRANKSKNKNLIMMVLITLFIGVIAITGKGTYAYFTAGEKILPAETGGIPVYNNFTLNYTDHTESQVDDGVTVYFDISSFLSADANWNAPYPCVYFSITGTRTENSGWSTLDMPMRFDSITNIAPADTSKCKTTTWVESTSTMTTTDGLGGIDWSGCWLKYKITNTKFNIVSGENRRVIIHRSNSASYDDQTANNIEISTGVKEVYIKALAELKDNSKRDWKKLEVSY